jgi:membrane associated rhomboid family serine protease
MKKLFSSKLFIVLLAFGGLIALLLLSAALRDFTFRPPEPFSLNFGHSGPLQLPTRPEEAIPLWKLLLFGALLFFIFLVLLLLLDPETRKLLLKKLFRFVLTMLAIWIALQYAYKNGSLEQTVDMLTGTGQNIPQQADAPPLPEYVPPQINPWVVFGVSFGVALVLVLVGWWIYTRRPRPEQSISLDEIAGIAREARAGLQDGGDWDNAIVRCYVRMNEVVTNERGLVRQLGSTPAEFALHLERAGLPGEAVRTLTRLFEGVRYGGQKTSPVDRDMASAALSAILHYCGVNA